MASNDSSAKKKQSETEQTVTYTLNPAANLAAYGFADGKSVFAEQTYLATEEEYAERARVRVSRSDGSTVAAVIKA